MKNLEISVEYVEINSIAVYSKNSRTHSAEQIAQIAASIKEFGWTNPILIDDSGSIIAGHGRLLAAQDLRLSEVPVIKITNLTETQRRAYVIADNKLAENAGWDDELLRLELGDLQDLNFDITITGFDEDFFIGEDAVIDLPSLNDGDKSPFQQKTFSLHDEQANEVDDAISAAKKSPLCNTGLNDNSNGNALALICSEWMRSRHGIS